LRVGLAFLAAAACAQEPVRRYDLAGGEATDALREFARASGLQLLFPERAIRGTELPPLHGEFAADEALKRLLAQSELEAVSDPTTGAYAVRRRVAVPSRNEVVAPVKRTRTAAGDPTLAPPLELSPVRIEQRRDLGVTTQSILRADRSAPLYHHVATRDDIEQSGVTSMAEFVTTLPGYSGEGAEALQATADLTFLGGANVYAGSFLKLRGWDAQHTTVLLNGRRLPASPESRGPDLSRIPLAAVERVEVMPFAGSAIYGDGAAGGAMNIVLRKDFAGQSFSWQVGHSTRGGGGEIFFTWIEGLASASGRTKATLIGDYQRRGVLRLGDRDYLRRAVSRLPAERLLPSGTPGPDLRAVLAAKLTGYPAVFAVTESAVDLAIPGRSGARFAVVPAGSNAAQLALGPGVETDPTKLATRRQERVVLRRPTESFNLSAQLEHVVAPETFELYAELGYARADERFSAPDAIEPLTLSPVDLRNPFRNDPARGVFDRRVRLYFDPTDLPDARFRQMRDSIRAVVGGRGVAGRSWHWVIDGFVDWSQSRTSVRSYGASLNDLTRTWTPFRAPALVPIYDPLADHRTDPIAVEVRERYLAREAWLDYRSRLIGAEFRLGGKVVDLPAGPLRMALGAEYTWRDLVTRQQVAASAELYAMLAALNANGSNGVAGDTFATLTRPWTREDRGERIGTSVEAILPLVDGRKQRVPVESVELNLASRTGRTDGGRPASSTLAALKVAPSTSWALRGTVSQGHVTPDSALVHDPVVETMTTASARDPRRGGVPQVYAFKMMRGGSRTVRAETSQARVAGVLFTPVAAPGLFASVDAWSITMRDRLRVPTLQEMVDHEAFFPGRVVRGEPQAWESLLGWAGPVTSVDQRPVQVTGLRAEGVDMEIRYRLPPTKAGTFTLTGHFEVVHRYEEQLLPVTPAVDKIDVVVQDASSGGLMESAVVSPRARAGLGWQRGAWHALVGMAYTPRYRTETTTPTAVLPAATGLDGDFIGSSIRWDFQVGGSIHSARAAAFRRWFSDTSWTLGVRNVFDREPAYRSDGTSFYSRFDDPRMRFVYVRAQWRR
jgi:outer membrane receptor protein involved in Fe transport